MSNKHLVIIIWFCTHGGSLLGQRPNEYERELMEGSQLASKFHHAEAIPHYTRALALKPGTAEALALRCQSYHETGDDELATKDCEAAIEADSQQPLGYRFRAAIAMERGNCKAALLDIAKAIELDPEDHNVHGYKAMCLEKEHDLEGAVKAMDVAILLEPGNPYGWIGRANLYRKLGRLKKARADAERAIEIAPTLAAGWQHLSLIKRDAGDPSGAADALRTAELLKRGTK